MIRYDSVRPSMLHCRKKPARLSFVEVLKIATGRQLPDRGWLVRFTLDCVLGSVHLADGAGISAQPPDVTLKSSLRRFQTFAQERGA